MILWSASEFLENFEEPSIYNNYIDLPVKKMPYAEVTLSNGYEKLLTFPIYINNILLLGGASLLKQQ